MRDIAEAVEVYSVHKKAKLAKNSQNWLKLIVVRLVFPKNKLMLFNEIL